VQAKPEEVAEAAPEKTPAAAETGPQADTAVESLETPAAEPVLEAVEPLDTVAATDPEEAAGGVAAADTTAATSASKSEAPALLPENWPDILAVLKLSGVTLTLASNCQLAAASDSACVLKLAEHHASLWNSAHEERIALAISELYQAEIRITIEVGDTDVETPAQRTERQRAENQAKAVAEIESDDHVRQLIETFNGTLDPDSIAPLKRAGSGE